MIETEKNGSRFRTLLNHPLPLFFTLGTKPDIDRSDVLTRSRNTWQIWEILGRNPNTRGNHTSQGQKLENQQV